MNAQKGKLPITSCPFFAIQIFTFIYNYFIYRLNMPENVTNAIKFDLSSAQSSLNEQLNYFKHKIFATKLSQVCHLLLLKGWHPTLAVEHLIKSIPALSMIPEKFTPRSRSNTYSTKFRSKVHPTNCYHCKKRKCFRDDHKKYWRTRNYYKKNNQNNSFNNQNNNSNVQNPTPTTPTHQFQNLNNSQNNSNNYHRR